MKRLTFTELAETSLAEIAQWTAETFGARQADIYQREILERCIALANGEAPSRSCRATIHPDLAEDLRYAQVGGHIVVFVETAAEAVVQDFLHQREDLPGKIAGLGKGESR